MNKTKSGCLCRKDLPLRSVLREWQKLNERIAQEWISSKDVPWWYNERASLSVFAGAVWNSGAFSFEEFSDEKRKISKRSLKFHRAYSGRVDLYFNIRKRDFIAEAKICWPRCGRLSSGRQKMIEEGLIHACHDIRISKPNGQRRLGVLFVSPRWKTNLKHDMNDRIDQWISRICEIDCDAVAWIFPADSRKIHAYDYFYPGTAVLIKEVRR
jgi:hypothetical protein